MSISPVKTGSSSPPVWVPLLCREQRAIVSHSLEFLGCVVSKLPLKSPLSWLKEDVTASPCVCVCLRGETSWHSNHPLQKCSSKLQAQTFYKTQCVSQRLRVLSLVRNHCLCKPHSTFPPYFGMCLVSSAKPSTWLSVFTWNTHFQLLGRKWSWNHLVCPREGERKPCGKSKQQSWMYN